MKIDILEEILLTELPSRGFGIEVSEPDPEGICVVKATSPGGKLSVRVDVAEVTLQKWENVSCVGRMLTHAFTEKAWSML